MSQKKNRGGVPVVQVPVDTSTSAGSFVAVAPTVTAIAGTADDFTTGAETPLPFDTYQVLVGILGRDAVNGGYTVGPTTVASPAMALTVDASHTTLQVVVAASDLDTAGARNAAALAIYLQRGSAEPQAAGYYAVPVSGDFVANVISLPVVSSPTYTTTLLNSATVDPVLGSRVPKVYNFVTLGPTQDGVDEAYTPTNIEYRPDSSGNYRIPTTYDTPLTFQVLPNQMREILKSIGGSYATSSHSSKTFYTGKTAILVTAAISNGNRPVKLIYPTDPLGGQEVAVFLDRILRNVAEIRLAWKKNAPTTVNFRYDSSPQDDLLDSQNAVARFEVGR